MYGRHHCIVRSHPSEGVKLQEPSALKRQLDGQGCAEGGEIGDRAQNRQGCTREKLGAARCDAEGSEGESPAEGAADEGVKDCGKKTRLVSRASER